MSEKLTGQVDTTQVIIVIIAIALGAYALTVGPSFEKMLINLQQRGFFTYLLPFVLVFVLTYGWLKGLKIVQDDWVNLVVALVFALFALLFFSTLPILAFLASLLGRLAVILIAVMITFLIYGFLTSKKGGE